MSAHNFVHSPNFPVAGSPSGYVVLACVAMATRRAAAQTAIQGIRGLNRRRHGAIYANAWDDSVDKWGHKKAKAQQAPNLLGLPVNGLGRPAPRASLVANGRQCKSSGRRQNGLHLIVNESLTAQIQQHSLSRRKNENINGQSRRMNGLSTNQHSGDNSVPGNGKESERNWKFDSDLIVVLDMDECLIHSRFLSDQAVDYRQDENRPGSAAFGEEESIIHSACESFRVALPDGDFVQVNKRPNLDLFLREVTSRFETYVFTAAMEVYASPVLDVLDPSGDMFRGRLYREQCTYDEVLNVYTKDLCNVLRHRRALQHADGHGLAGDPGGGFICDERRVVLVDNNPVSFIPNPSNGILVSNFYDDPKDDTLEACMELLLELDETEDVRPLLDGKFGLKDALEDVAYAGGSSDGYGW